MEPKKYLRERADLDGLTDAAADIARAVCDGATNGEIAAARGTSIHTVANQIATLMRKLGVSSRVELAVKLASPSADEAEVTAASALTSRENRICLLVSKGNRDKEIAHTLGVSTASVSAGIHRARKKLRVRTRVELATIWSRPARMRAHP